MKNEFDEEMPQQLPPPPEADPLEEAIDVVLPEADPLEEAIDVVLPGADPLEEAIDVVLPGDVYPKPTPVKMLTAEQFIQQAQEPQLANMIDDILDRVKQTTGATRKQILRACFLVLRSIAMTMPWDEDEGLDAKRFHTGAKIAMPSWRECIGVLLQLEFSKPDEEGAEAANQAEVDAEAAKVESSDDDSK